MMNMKMMRKRTLTIIHKRLSCALKRLKRQILNLLLCSPPIVPKLKSLMDVMDLKKVTWEDCGGFQKLTTSAESNMG